ncbi:MAG: endonuclease/exonuclease/phosphatase family protein [Cyanobacteria bacterium P01_F01_bin.143]
MRILSANLWCYNPWQKQTISKLGQLDADILVLQEVKPSLVDWLREYASKENFTFIQVATNKQMTLCVLSRFPISHSEIIDSESFAGRPQIKVELDSGITVFGLHLMAPITLKKSALRNRQLEQLAKLINQETNSVIAIGDFNTDIKESVFKKLMTQTNDCSHSRERFLGRKSWLSVLPFFAIDHLIFTGHFHLESFVVGELIWSDHLPIIADISLKN